jgi:acetyltransferase
MRPYPVQYVSSWKMKGGASVLIRPIRPEDEPAMARFHETISDRSTYLRFFHAAKLSSRVAHDRLVRRCSIDYDQEMAFVAEYESELGATPQIIAVGRLVRAPGTRDAEVAVLVADAFQKLGLGSELLGRLIGFARDERLERLIAVVLPENLAMRSIAARHGFAVVKSEDLSTIQLSLSL